MTKYKRIATFVLCLALVLTIGGECILSLFSLKTSAATSSYSSVLDDLNKDKDFNPSDYPAIENDYSLQVIQVAEGENGELFVYVYQPCHSKDVPRAAKINMALENPSDETVDYSLYTLTWLSSDGTLGKYKVDGFVTSNDSVRYYSIAAIYREFREDLGDVHEAGTDDVTNYKAFKVGVSWACATDSAGNYFCQASSMQTVNVKIRALGFTRFSDGYDVLDGTNRALDSHFVAFSIENFENVQHIYDAEISYWTQYLVYSYSSVSKEKELNSSEEPVYHEEILRDTDGTSISVNPGVLRLFAESYSWDRITTSEQFVSETEKYNCVFAQGSADVIKNECDFVFRYLETPYSEREELPTLWALAGTESIEVTLLRLKFLVGEDVYNLGVVADIVSDDGEPDIIAGGNVTEELFEKILMVLGIVILLVLISIFIHPLSAIFSVIWTGIKFIGQCIITILSAPFEFIASLFKQDK